MQILIKDYLFLIDYWLCFCNAVQFLVLNGLSVLGCAQIYTVRLFHKNRTSFHLDLLADGALLSIITRVDVELDRILGNVLKDLHQTAEDLGL